MTNDDIKLIDMLDLRHFWYLGPWLIWVGVKFPWLHIRRRHR